MSKNHRITNRLSVSAVELYMRVGIYVRVSTRDQNCAMQLRDLRAYCTARQPTWFANMFLMQASRDEGFAPELSELMSAVHRRKPDAVIVWRLTDLPVRRDTFLPRWKSSRSLCRVHFVPGEDRHGER